MTRLKPSLRSTETYTETNFLRLHTVARDEVGPVRLVTLEHLSYSADPGTSAQRGWSCLTIVDSEAMTQEDALFIARSYALEHGVPVIYECHSD